GGGAVAERRDAGLRPNESGGRGMKYLNWRQRRSLAAYRRRLATFEETQQEPPDGRDSDLKARGLAIEWKRRVLANEKRRAERRFAERVIEARAEAMRRWNGNVVDIREARR